MAKELKKVKDFKDEAAGKIQGFLDAMNSAYRSNDGNEVDKATEDLYKFLETIMPKDDSFYIKMKNHTWQKNHMLVLANISELMQTINRMPSNTEIARAAGLSEETVYKHLKGMGESELYKGEEDKFKLMKNAVLTTVYNKGLQGDVRACKVYLDYFQSNNIAPVSMPAPTNFIQINNLKITPDELQKLPPATLQKIETLIKMPVKVKRVIQIKN